MSGDFRKIVIVKKTASIGRGETLFDQGRHV